MKIDENLHIKIKAAIVVSGISGGIVQILVLREILAGFAGTELLTEVVTAGWMAVNALGCLAAYRLFRNIPLKILLRLQLCIGIVGLFTCCGMLAGCSFLASNSHAQMNWLCYSGLALAILLPFCLLSGVQYTVAVWALADLPEYAGVKAASIGYVYDSLGMLAGFLLVTLFLALKLNTVASAMLVLGINLIMAILFSFSLPKMKRTIMIMVLSGILMFSSAIAFHLPELIFQSIIEIRTPSEKLEDEIDTKYSRLLVTSSSEQYNFYTSGYLESAYPDYNESIEKKVHFALLLHPDPQKVFVMGGLTSGVLDEVLKYKPDKVVYGDIDPDYISMALRYLEMAGGNKYSYVDFIVNDVRSYFQQTNETYDVIILTPPVPATLAANRYYTQEFFSLAEKDLEEDGLLVTETPSTETYAGISMKRLNASILLALESAFDHTLVIPGNEGVLIASNGYDGWANLEQNIIKRYDERHLNTKLISPEFTSYTLNSRRLKEARENFEFEGSCIANSDSFPSSIWYYSMVKNEQENIPDSNIASFLSGQPPLRLFFVFFLVLLLPVIIQLAGTVFSRRKGRRHFIEYIAFLSGMSGFSCLTILTYLYQVKIGSLYSDIGIISAASLCGYALGATIARKIKHSGKRAVVTIFFCIQGLLALILLSVKQPLLLENRVEFIMLILLSGSFHGALYPLLSEYTASAYKGELGNFFGLYALELVGSATGAVLTGIILLGTIGLFYTILLIFAAIALCVMLSLWPASSRMAI